MAWHRDAAGQLVQRFIFALLMFVTILLLSLKVESEATSKSVYLSLIPAVTLACFILCKVMLCFLRKFSQVVWLKTENTWIWISLIFCIFSQWALLFLNDDIVPAEYAFLPSLVLLFMLDVWCIRMTCSKRQLALGDPPKALRLLGVILAFLSAASTLAFSAFLEYYLVVDLRSDQTDIIGT